MIRSSLCVLENYSPKTRIDMVHRFIFKTTGAWDNCALLAVFNHQLAMDFDAPWGQSAHFLKEDCFECLSPHKKAA